MIESLWSRMQVELLDRQSWRTRVELANAIFEYLEIFHNRQRRHRALGMLTPIEFEAQEVTVWWHEESSYRAPRNRGKTRASDAPGAVQSVTEVLVCVDTSHRHIPDDEVLDNDVVDILVRAPESRLRVVRSAPSRLQISAGS